jgi:hypothetical protein
MTMDSAHVEWSRQHFELMADGGMWGVPRSGLMFRKEGDKLVLTTLMPWQEGMPITAKELQEQQDNEYEDIKRHFEAAGVTVTR